MEERKLLVQERDDTFDIIKGICILLMVIGHCPIDAVLKNFIYSFHMPVFFFVAGFFFKQKNFIKTLDTSIRRLVIPFVFVFSIIFVVGYIIDFLDCFSIIVFSRIDVDNLTHDILFNEKNPVWFLLALFWCRIIFTSLRKIKNDTTILVIVMVAAVVAINAFYFIKPPLSIVPGFAALGIYTIGHFLVVQKFFTSKRLWWIIPLLLGIWIICMQTGKRLNIAFNMYNGFYFLDVLGALGIFILLYFFVKNSFSNAKTWNFLKWCGANSLVILCVHSIEFNFINYSALRRVLSSIFIPYELNVLVMTRLAFDLGIAYALIKCKFIKKYIFAQYN